MANVIQISGRLIQTAFNTYWSGLATPPAIAWENVPFRQPDSGEWIKVFVQFGEIIQASLGSSPLEFVSGLVMVQIFTPKQIGARRSEVITDLVMAGLRYRQIAESGVSIDFRNTMIGGMGETEDSFQRMVSAEFRANHVAAVAV